MITSDIIQQQSFKRPVVLYFWAAWCGPCRSFGHKIEKLSVVATEWILMKVNTTESSHNEHGKLIKKYKVKGIPVAIIIHEGKEIARLKKDLSENKMRAWLEEHLPNPKRDALRDIRENTIRYPSNKSKKRLENLLGNYPMYHNAQVEYARHMIFTQSEGSYQSAIKISVDNTYFPIARAIIDLHKFYLKADTDIEWNNSEKIQQIKRYLRGEKITSALNTIVSEIKDDDKALKTYANLGKSIFLITGLKDPNVKKYYEKYQKILLNER